MQRATRVLVANRPKIMRDLIFAALADRPDVEIVGETDDEGEILRRVEAVKPDLLVIGLNEDEERPAICDQVLRVHLDLRIVAVASRKDRTVCYWASFDIHCIDIEASAAGILNAIYTPAECFRRPS